MKAVLCRAFGPPEQLEVGEIETPTPATGEIVLGVRACAVNSMRTLLQARACLRRKA